MKKKHKVEAVLLICILFISIFNIPVVKVKAEDNMNYPKELMLGTFFNSEKPIFFPDISQSAAGYIGTYSDPDSSRRDRGSWPLPE